MTLDDWVALAMIGWRGRGRRAVAAWLSDPQGAARLGAGSESDLPAVLTSIAPRLATPGRLAEGRTRARAALAAAQAVGIAAVPSIAPNCQVLKCHIHDQKQVYMKLSSIEMSYT